MDGETRGEKDGVSRKENLGAALAALLSVAVLHCVFMLVSGKGLFSKNDYNSFTLQACSWLEGRLDLGRDYPWLELAVFEGKYYVSFPPFPSYVLLPFAVVFGGQTPDSLLAFCVMLVGVFYAVRLARNCGVGGAASVVLAVFLYCSNNLWQITVDGWVWFFAQNCSFTLTVMAFVYAKEGKKGRACFFLCAAVGCRPFQILYFPLVCLLLVDSRTQRKGGFKWLVWSKDYRLIPAAALAVSFLALNYARFGSPLEFGHNYLPEFTRAEYGQFSLHYLGRNLWNLVRLPQFDPHASRLVFPMSNGCNVFLVYPVLTLGVVSAAADVWRVCGQKEPVVSKRQLLGHLLTALLVLSHLFLLCLHKTMGGAHFGNRYAADAVPVVYLSLCISAARWEARRVQTGKTKASRLSFIGFFVLFLWGLLINFTGVLSFYNQMSG